MKRRMTKRPAILTLAMAHAATRSPRVVRPRDRCATILSMSKLDKSIVEKDLPFNDPPAPSYLIVHVIQLEGSISACSQKY